VTRGNHAGPHGGRHDEARAGLDTPAGRGVVEHRSKAYQGVRQRARYLGADLDGPGGRHRQLDAVEPSGGQGARALEEA
jgi:hypothetical protein